MKNVLVIDANPPWIRSLFAAMNCENPIHTLHVHNAFSKARPGVGRLLKWERQGDGLWVKNVLVPGWTKFPGWSSRLIRRAANKAMPRMGGVDMIVYTLPFYAEVAESLRGKVLQVYHAHDPFRFYEWDVARTVELERKMLAACDGAFAISRALAEDLKKQSTRPVYYCPNAVSTSFLEKLAAGGPAAEQLKSVKRPIIGCIGQINRSYDWEMIGAMADGMPEATFVFVGPVIEASEEHKRAIDGVFGRANVKWLGPQPHQELPGYLRGFDVCLNPLAMSEHNDRRSPLRLYDYLATDRPILSTAIGEALAHGGLIETFRTAEEGMAMLRRMTGAGYRVDVVARGAYIRNNTWPIRAAEFLRDASSLQQASGA